MIAVHDGGLMSKFGEAVLRRLSRDPQAGDYVNDVYKRKHYDSAFYADYLLGLFPEIKDIIKGKRVLDIGCAEGREAGALMMLGAESVEGIDIIIRDPISAPGVNLSIMDATKMAYPDESFDAVVTCGSFEHFADPEAVPRESSRVLRHGGHIFITSGVWCHPWGAHMNFFTNVPWVQFLFSEKTIMNVRKLYRNDGASRFHEVEGGLNKIGIASFCKIADSNGLVRERMYLRPCMGMKMLTRIPVVREFFSNLIVAVLRKP
jgi:SAM-dependent methyltransferase